MARTHLVQERRAATSCGGPRAWGLAPIFCLTLLFPGVSWATKVTPPVDLAIAGDASTLVLGGTATVTLTVTPRVDVALGRVQFQSSSGDVEIVGAGEIDLGAVKAGTHYPVSVPVRIAGQGKAEVRGWFYAFDDRNGLQFGRSRALYFVISSTGVLAGDTSFIDLELAQAKRLREAKSLNGEQYRARIHNLMGHQGIESIKFEKTGSVDNASAGNKATFRLDGYINWTDPTGATHRAPYTRVEIYEHNASGDELITTAETSLGGYYKADIDNADPEGGGRDIFIRALSMNNDRARVMNATTGDTYFIQSSVAPDIADSAFLHIDLTANNTDTPDRAFSAHHALGVLVDATGYYLGGSLPRIDVDFPTTMSTSNYSGAVLHVLMDDWIDWDVIDHEYGHYFMHERNIESNPGGVHALNENLGERVGKDAGIRQAWGEGFPTYFGVSSQQVMGLDRLGMLNVADSRYQDTIDSTIDYDLEASSPGATFLGEDNEASVQRILWDLYDGDADGQDRVKLRYANVYNAAVSVHATNLSEFWNGLLALTPLKAVTMKQNVDYGSIFTEHKVAPGLTAPEDNFELGPDTPSPTFTWEANGAGPSHRLNKFRIDWPRCVRLGENHCRVHGALDGDRPEYGCPRNRRLYQ
ncbi:MAG: hypothetical protein HZB26_05935 [Candidatus Hydrogenedentes bacterium]|nr:hypothetical protein [Candidatus Hydrogenedentota bacterium]